MQGDLRIGLAEATVLVALAQAVAQHQQQQQQSGSKALTKADLEQAADLVKQVCTSTETVYYTVACC